MKYDEPALQGRKKKAKDLRKKLLQEAYSFVEVGDTLLASDFQVVRGCPKRIDSKYIGTIVTEKQFHQFRRRTSGFIPIEQLQSKGK